HQWQQRIEDVDLRFEPTPIPGCVLVRRLDKDKKDLDGIFSGFLSLHFNLMMTLKECLEGFNQTCERRLRRVRLGSSSEFEVFPISLRERKISNFICMIVWANL